MKCNPGRIHLLTFSPAFGNRTTYWIFLQALVCYSLGCWGTARDMETLMADGGGSGGGGDDGGLLLLNVVSIDNTTPMSSIN